jgi:hypothetical protein
VALLVDATFAIWQCQSFHRFMRLWRPTGKPQMLKVLHTSSVSGVALIAILTANAHAADAQKVADAVKAQMAGQGLAVTIGSSVSEGEDVVLKGVAIGPAGETFTIEAIRLEQVTDGDNGGFKVGRIAAPEFTTTDDGFTIAFGGAELQNLTIPSPTETDPVKKLLLTTGGSIGKITVSDASGQIFTMAGGTYTMSPYTPGGVMDYAMSFDGIAMDFTKAPDEKTRAVMSELGYANLTGNFKAAGQWNTVDGRYTASDMTFLVDNAAALKMTFDIAGYTPAFVASIQEISKQMAEAGNDESKAQAQGLAMLGLMQQLTFNAMSIRVEDASLTGKLLDFAAKQQGTDRATIVNQTKGVLPFMLAQLQNPEFAQKITDAVNAYLDNPKSLTIKAAPPAPVPFAQIAAAGMAAPQSIPQVLGVTVTAND